MKNVMKRVFSLLLVGVVAVSMFGFIAPTRAEAAGDRKGWIEFDYETMISEISEDPDFPDLIEDCVCFNAEFYKIAKDGMEKDFISNHSEDFHGRSKVRIPIPSGTELATITITDNFDTCIDANANDDAYTKTKNFRFFTDETDSSNDLIGVKYVSKKIRERKNSFDIDEEHRSYIDFTCKKDCFTYNENSNGTLILENDLPSPMDWIYIVRFKDKYLQFLTKTDGVSCYYKKVNFSGKNDKKFITIPSNAAYIEITVIGKEGSNYAGRYTQFEIKATKDEKIPHSYVSETTSYDGEFFGIDISTSDNNWQKVPNFEMY